VRRVGKKEGDSYLLSVFYSKNKRQFGNYGQISTFLIVALVLVLVVAVTFFVVNLKFSFQDKTNQAVISDLALFPPEQFVTHCVQKESVDAAKFIFPQGGVADIADAVSQSSGNSSRAFAATTFRAQSYLFWARFNDGGNNLFITNDFVAGQLNSQLPRLLYDCINLSLYAQQGYEVKSGAIRTNTSINKDTIHVIVYYPLTLTKGSTTIDRTTFSVDVDLPVGKLLDDAREITNSHLRAQSGSGDLLVDTQAIMHQTDNVWLGKPLITVEKETVYPHTLYSLNLNYKGIDIPLQFAIEGNDQFASGSSGISSTANTFASASSCVDSSGNCFVGVSYDLCTAGGGEYRFGQTCQSKYSLTNTQLTNTQSNSQSAADIDSGEITTINSFSSCALTNGTTMASGSSWCATTPDGSPFIGVGSRASRLLCVNGKILQEPCQDYRSEVCAQQYIDAKSGTDIKNSQFFVAQCRPNTALSCSACTDQSCCNAADCVYQTVGAPAVGICVPKVPQGIPFWRGDTSNSNEQICQEQYSKYATQLSSTNSNSLTVQLKAQICALSADCGATLSVVGEPSQTQDSTYYSKLSSFWLSRTPQSQFLLQTPSIALGTSFNGGTTNSNSQSLSTILGNRLSDIEPLAAYSQTDYLNPNVSISSTSNSADISSGVCSSFVPSLSPSCGYCTAFGRACSEYVCRSLGASCRAIQNASSDSGVTCVDSSLSANSANAPLQITSVTDGAGNVLAALTINGKADAGSNSVSVSALGSISGFSYPTTLSARELLTINLTTNRAALCKPTYLPSQSFSDVDSLDLSFGQYSTSHQVRLRFVNDLPVFDRILSSFAVPNYEQLVQTLATFKLRLDQLRLKYGFIQKYNPTFYPYLDSVVSQYLSDKTRPILLSLLDDVAQKKFEIFFVCQDEFGNQLDKMQSPFVQIQLQSSCQPTPPQILHIVPDADPYVQQRVSFYLDKAGSCKYDTQSVPYDQMKFNMSCASSEYDISSAYDGSYECDAAISSLPKSDGSTPLQIYYSCADTITNALVARNITFTFSADANGNSSQIINLTNSTNSVQSSFVVGENTTMNGIGGYRCELASAIAAANPFTLACTTSACTLRHVENNSSPQTQQTVLSCNPRIVSQSCQFADVHVSDPTAYSLTKLPSFAYDSVGVVGSQFVVSTKGRGGDISCSLISASGATFALSKKDNSTFVMPASLLTDNTLVKITCKDSFGTGPQYVSLIKK